MNTWTIFLLMIAGGIIMYLIIKEVVKSKKSEKKMNEVISNGNTK